MTNETGQGTALPDALPGSCWPRSEKGITLGLMVPLSEAAAFGATPRFEDIVEIGLTADADAGGGEIGDVAQPGVAENGQGFGGFGAQGFVFDVEPELDDEDALDTVLAENCDGDGLDRHPGEVSRDLASRIFRLFGRLRRGAGREGGHGEGGGERQGGEEAHGTHHASQAVKIGFMAGFGRKGGGWWS